jgi:nicotinate phosphoribosyltransferase
MLLTNYAPVTDLYQLTMAQAYLKLGMGQTCATFDLFVRNLPKDWRYLVACGIEEALDTLEDFRFSGEDAAFLAQNGFSQEFCDYLRAFRFRGTVRGVREGTPVFPHEPLLEVTGNIIEAQIVETILLSLVNYQTLICSKASRIVAAAQPAAIVDFGLRRAPGPEAGIRAARAAYIAGATGTSNVEAAKRFGIPINGTMAHSFVMAHASELEAFRAWCEVYPEYQGTTLLIDTYNVEQGARNACQVVREGAALRAVRLDSGDFEKDTYRVRTILDDAGLGHVRIIVSGDMNEDKIYALKHIPLYDATYGSPSGVDIPPYKSAPIDGFGVGTEMVTARPEAALGGVYKLVEVDGKPRIKLSSGKETWPGRKQVWRSPDLDILGLESETGIQGRPLLELLLQDGKRLRKSLPLTAVRDYCRKEVKSLPAGITTEEHSTVVRRMVGTADTILLKGPSCLYPVAISRDLRALREAMERTLR